MSEHETTPLKADDPRMIGIMFLELLADSYGKLLVREFIGIASFEDANAHEPGLR